MLHKNMPIGAAIATLKREVADRQSALAILEALVAPSGQPAPTAKGATRGRRKGMFLCSICRYLFSVRQVGFLHSAHGARLLGARSPLGQGGDDFASISSISAVGKA